MSNKKDKILFWLEHHSIHFGIAKTLQEKYDCDLYALISCSPKQKTFFDNQTLINFKKKWFTRDYIDLEKPKINIKNLQLMENSLNISLSKIIFGERLFYKFNKYYDFSDTEIHSILYQELNFYNKILDEINPDYVIMRAPEFQDIELFYEVCKAKKIPVLILSSMKFGARWIISSKPYPPIQFAKLNDLIEIKDFDVLKKHVQEYSKIYRNTFSQEGKANSKISQKLSAIKLLFSTFNSSNINSYHDMGKTPWSIFFKTLSLSLQSYFRKSYLDKNAMASLSTETPFAYFPLHAEPDVALLRIGDFYSDQIGVIKNIAQSMPIGMKLFVKEHPSMWAVGWRDTTFYKQIIELPNVELVHPSISSEKIIQDSSFVITIAGTAALEATFYKKPVVVFSDINCSTLSSVLKINDLKDLPEIIKKCLTTKVDLIELNHYFNELEKSTFVCDVEDLQVMASNIFGVGGMLNTNEISESKMKWFIEEYSKDFDILATEHVKQIQLSKQTNSTLNKS